MKIFSLVFLLLIFPCLTFASTFNIKCMNDKGKFSSCKVSIENNQISIAQRDSVKVIEKNQITRLTMGEYSRRRVAEAIIFTPWLLLSKKKRDDIGIEYKQNNANQVAVLETKKKYGMPIKMQLQAMTGLTFEDASKNTEWKEQAN